MYTNERMKMYDYKNSNAFCNYFVHSRRIEYAIKRGINNGMQEQERENEVIWCR